MQNSRRLNRGWPAIAVSGLIVAIALSATFLTWQATLAIQPSELSITQSELVSRLDSNTAPVILDVRTPDEYAAGHIPGAINIDYRELPERSLELQPMRDRDIVVYCERGVRARVAEETLQGAGFTRILLLNGDMTAWRANGLPIALPDRS